MKRVLIVDDVEGWRNFHSQAIKYIFENKVEIDTADSGESGYSKVLENNNTPYDFILTDLQMEENYDPKYAGEWLVEQIKTLPKYYKTRVIIISAAYNIRHIADTLNVDCIPKNTARTCISAYEELLK